MSRPRAAKAAAGTATGNPRRVVTAASLFDGHDAAINLVRRLLQDAGCEVIHLGHDRGVDEVVAAAVQEDPHAIAVSSYQGGHMEYFTYLLERLREEGLGHVRVFGGGGGVILPEEAEELESRGVTRIFRPEHGQELGLLGMIQEVVDLCDFEPAELPADGGPDLALARALTRVEGGAGPSAPGETAPVVGLTGTGGAGKSSLVDEVVLRFRRDFPDRRLCILSADPTRRRTGGALLGDRIRMNAIYGPGVFMRSLATRGGRALSTVVEDAVAEVAAAGFDLILLETAGIGQADDPVSALADVTVYVMTAEYGAPSQLEKIEMLDTADLVVLNKFDRRAAPDALREVRKQVRRLRFSGSGDLDGMPVYPTIASQFADPGVDAFYLALLDRLAEAGDGGWESALGPHTGPAEPEKHVLIPPGKEDYLHEIAETARGRRERVEALVDTARLAQAAGRLLAADGTPPPEGLAPFGEAEEGSLRARYDGALSALGDEAVGRLRQYEDTVAAYGGDEASYEVRGREVRVTTATRTLYGTRIPKVALPRFDDWGDRLRWLALENVPGGFPFTAGVYPFRRTGEDPTRMFAGEGPPERTNRRFHLLAEGQPYARLSTAFDSVTLYGRDPEVRPDVWGKVGESGVSIATVEDMERLYAGFDLLAPETSVSMTINGPAPVILAFFLVTAARQAVATFAAREGRPPDAAEKATLEASAWSRVRGTVQADILKEDQAQNTCIFSTEFALKLMGDVQGWFIANDVRNFYSVSISGYHIAEAGAWPITQLAFTLANGFTYVEYYLARGMDVDEFGPNLSFFFSCGLDAEYQVLGRVARRIWATAMRDRYGSGERAQKLKYHIQTSGRSLHAQEIHFNDVRTTLQALMAYYDRCDSLHTNAYDEAITTPTEESVRRALAIQQIITKELGLAKCENPLQGSFLVEELTDLVEEAVLAEFEAISRRGGVLGAMETGYQRSKIQEESLHYEHLKHTGELPVVGVNTFLGDDRAPVVPETVTRASEEEKDLCVERTREFRERHAGDSAAALERLCATALAGGNVFAELMETVKVATLGQITEALFSVGGQYRRNL